MISTPDAKFGWQRGWLIVLALLSLVVPVVAIFLRNESVVPFADPARLSYDRQTVVALFLGLASALGAFAVTRTVPSSELRRLGMVLLTGGLLLNTYLLWTLIGSCGLQIFWENCYP